MAQDRTLVELVREKWCSYTSEVKNQDHVSCISLMLNAQKKYLDSLKADAPKILAFFVEQFGDSWDEHFLRAYVKAISESPILDFFPAQPLTMPIGSVAFFSSCYMDAPVTEEGEGIPELRMDIKTKEVCTKTTRTSCLLSPVTRGMRELFGRDCAKEVMGSFFGEVMREKLQGMLGILLHTSKKPVIYAPDGDKTLDYYVRHAGHLVHKTTRRGPSNRAVCNPIHTATVEDSTRRITFSDPDFPEDMILTYYSGPSILDQGAIWSPYQLVFHYEEVPEDDSADVMVPRLRAVWRDNLEIVNPGVIQSIEIKSGSV